MGGFFDPIIKPIEDILKDPGCAPCKANPSWIGAVIALRKAKDAGALNKDNWNNFRDCTILNIAEIDLIAAVVAVQCANCLEKEVF